MKITSPESLSNQVASVVLLKIARTTMLAEMEREIAAIQKRHQHRISDIEGTIALAESEILDYCTAHRAELFPTTKSLALATATIGFEFTPHRVEPANKKIKWADVIARLRRLDWGKAYLSQPDPKPDKNALLADRSTLTPEQLSAAGIRFVQDEQFYIRPNLQTAADTTQPA